LGAGLVLSLALGAFLRLGLPTVPAFERVRTASASSEARLLDRHGRILHERRVRSDERRLVWTPLAEISPALPEAVLSIEDRRFRAHRGVDPRSLAAAVLAQLRGERRGASTLTMQLAGELDPALRARKGARTLRQKLRQMAFALALERHWSKDQILEAYLNRVGYRGELVGVGAAARGLFDKAPHALDGVEAWLLAALLRSPNAPLERVAERACRLSALAGAEADCAAYAARVDTALARAPALRPPAALAPHLAARLLGRSGDVQTTLDADLQRMAIRTLSEQLDRLADRRVRDGAVLVVENSTGDVLAWVGSSGPRSDSRHVDFVRARRQAGSTLKPFLYALAFEDRILTPSTRLDDSPLEIPTGLGSYRPDNYDHRFHGPVPARVALGSSLNIPAVRVLERVGVDRAVVALRALGLRGLVRADYYGPSLALGAADVTLEELVGAYRALGRGGRAGALRIRAEDPPLEEAEVLEAGAAFLVADILADRGNRSLAFGLESELSTRSFAAVKTGTSKDMRDNWCLGFSDRYTVGVWVGNGSGEPMQNVSGVDGASPVWSALMAALHAGDPSRPPAPPASVVATASGFALRDTEPAVAPEPAAAPAGEAASVLSRIVSPAAGLVIAWDPDIPPSHQRVLVEARPPDARLALVLDGRPLGTAAEPRLWPVERGRHRLVLASEAGVELDRVSFVVR
jgi:penicillin-binding protein 1C